MELKRQIEILQEWACEKVNDGCRFCNFSIDGGDYFSHHYYCPFDKVIDASEQRAKEIQDSDTRR